MELTRRDALAALGGTAAAGGSAAALTWRSLRTDGERTGGDGPPEFAPGEVATLEAVAETLYPTEVSGIPDFVETYVVARAKRLDGRAAGMKAALGAVDDRARSWFDAPFAELSPDDRDAVMEQMGLDRRDPDPEGTAGQRARYYLVNELLYALYATPTGAELVGLPNPQGYPGGTASYRRGPPDA